MCEAIELHQQGFPVKEIAWNLGVTEGRVYQIFRANNYTLPKYNAGRAAKKLWTDEELSYLKSNLSLPVAELAKALGRSYTAVLSKLSKLDLHTHYHCVVCNTEISQKGMYCTDHNWIARTLTSTKNHCKKKGRKFELTNERAIELLLGSCTYCGQSGGGIDRIDSSKGYVEGNVTSCCTRCNTMKMDTPKDEWVAHMKLILENLNER